jgi:hypothetical protein
MVAALATAFPLAPAVAIVADTATAFSATEIVNLHQ